MAAFRNHTGLHPQQVQVLHHVQGSALPDVPDGMDRRGPEGDRRVRSGYPDDPAALSQSAGPDLRISLGVESGDDWTLDRIHKGYHAEDILEQCHKLEEAGIDYWMTFLNGVAGKSHSREHAIHSAEIFSQCRPMLVGTGGLTLFPGTPLLEEAQRSEFDPLSEKEMLEELKLFVENLTCDCSFITHHTISGVNLSGPDFLSRKERIVAALERQISHGDLDRMAALRRYKRTL